MIRNENDDKINKKIIIFITILQVVIEIKILNHRPVLEIFQKTIDTTTELISIK